MTGRGAEACAPLPERAIPSDQYVFHGTLNAWEPAHDFLLGYCLAMLIVTSPASTSKDRPVQQHASTIGNADHKPHLLGHVGRHLCLHLPPFLSQEGLSLPEVLSQLSDLLGLSCSPCSGCCLGCCCSCLCSLHLGCHTVQLPLHQGGVSNICSSGKSWQACCCAPGLNRPMSHKLTKQQRQGMPGAVRQGSKLTWGCTG